MNGPKIKDTDLPTGIEALRQAGIAHIGAITTEPQYSGAPATHILQPLSPPRYHNVDTHYYSSLSPSDAGHDQQQIPGQLDYYMQSPDHAAEMAAKEERRKRNTAASARFRMKKKQREQALERKMSQVQDKNAKLEEKVNQLEMENKWLKDLITEKNKRPVGEYGEHEDDLEALAHGRIVNGASET
ncbi:hypothetical protein AYO21_11976 [Fonsecaea monophora]|uniref:Unplaced genomic scaffold supercont1.6, whole genome shotgun sequence n=2 Tax=Fonsecaea TaxID=40354 RepID=A0A0D2G9B2_9EURO|nr:uncharacterized protein Z517_09749 [Fonsecaea pedrosoi CBS 271.37]XP_022505870.1 hypothetical protein AYO21_11976 [Fonsecaea monophora]KAH0829554.1 hypothetical protein FOPE_10785 [Fonsecaea pedrosoi]KIW77303.1 hypothetical protein Z517_09749 [Fonsecaea pedrosoi CBS 271.37]OAG33918.1 hypothetical protein AYO21_11976 [Fonsecaea monophora]